MYTRYKLIETKVYFIRDAITGYEIGPFYDKKYATNLVTHAGTLEAISPINYNTYSTFYSNYTGNTYTMKRQTYATDNF